MSKGRRNAIIVLLGAVVALLVRATMGLLWEDLRDWYVGYRFVWMPPGVTPNGSLGHCVNSSGEVAVDVHGSAREGGRWSFETGEVAHLRMVSPEAPASKTSSINDHGTVVGKGQSPTPPAFTAQPGR